MKKLLAVVLLCYTFVSAHDHYTAYSGAPGSSGTCASSCHGSGTGTIIVTGIPANYEPLKTYTITVKHNGGSTIVSFNASTRKGTTTTAGGTLAAGTGTSLYNVSGKETGISLTVNKFYVDSATFLWTAPASGSGPINFYIAGIQTGYSGATTKIVIGSSETLAEVDQEKNVISDFQLLQNYPNPFNPSTVINYRVQKKSNVELKIYDGIGKEIATLIHEEQNAGNYQVQFSAQQYHLSSGVYWYELHAGTFQSVKKMILTK